MPFLASRKSPDRRHFTSQLSFLAPRQRPHHVSKEILDQVLSTREHYTKSQISSEDDISG